MNPEEYANLARLEQEHWFYRGKREIVQHWLERLGGLAPDRLLVDVGAGTGGFAAAMKGRCRVLAVDDHAESLVLARERLGGEGVRSGTCTALPLTDGAADTVTALDVIEHVQDDAGAMREIARVLKPGGLLVITVPAFMSLWSDWDVALHHQRRYTIPTLRALVDPLHFEICHLNYTNVLVFPAVYVLRRWRSRSMQPRRESAGPRAEDRIPPAPLNEFLRWSYVALAKQGLVSFPFGVSILAVLRRRAS